MELADRTVMLLGGSGLVAYEMLGPPRLTKLLCEAYLCGRVRSSVRALADTRPAELAASAHRLLQDVATWVFTVEDRGTRIKR